MLELMYIAFCTFVIIISIALGLAVAMFIISWVFYKVTMMIEKK